jgi:hypothetical protein
LHRFVVQEPLQPEGLPQMLDLFRSFFSSWRSNPISVSPHLAEAGAFFSWQTEDSSRLCGTGLPIDR